MYIGDHGGWVSVLMTHLAALTVSVLMIHLNAALTLMVLIPAFLLIQWHTQRPLTATHIIGDHKNIHGIGHHQCNRCDLEKHPKLHEQFQRVSWKGNYTQLWNQDSDVESGLSFRRWFDLKDCFKVSHLICIKVSVVANKHILVRPISDPEKIEVRDIEKVSIKQPKNEIGNMQKGQKK